MRQAIIRLGKLSCSIGNLYNTLSMTSTRIFQATSVSKASKITKKSLSRKCLRYMHRMCVLRMQFILSNCHRFAIIYAQTYSIHVINESIHFVWVLVFSGHSSESKTNMHSQKKKISCCNTSTSLFGNLTTIVRSSN